MKTLKIDKSFIPFIIVVISILIAIVVIWCNFDTSFGGSY